MAVNDSLSTDTWYRFRWCLERGHYDFLQKAQKCDSYFVGEQWDANDLNALRLARRPALTINKIISTMSTIMGEQIYNRNEITFRPSGEGATSDVADALTKVWQQIAQQNQLSWLRSDVFADGIIRSRAFYDVRMDFQENMKGRVLITTPNSKNVVVDPDAESYDPDEWGDVFTTKWLTYGDIATLYDEEDALYLRDRDGSSFPYAYDVVERVRDRFAGQNLIASYGVYDKDYVRRNIRVVERQHKVLTTQKHFVDVMTGDMRPIPDAWDRNRIAEVLQRYNGQLNVFKKKVRRVRWTVVADNCVLHDDWSPYKRFTVVPYFPHFHHGKTVGLVENLISPQDLLNKTSSQELHVVNTSANSGWKVKQGALTNMTVEELEATGAQTGIVIELNDMEGLDKIQPNNTPQGMDRLSYKAEEHMKAISGVSDSMQGMDREDVAAKAIGYKKQSGQTNLVRVLDNLERSDFFLARAVLDLVQEYYTTERLVSITSNDLMNTAQHITVNQYDPVADEIVNDLTLGTYHIVITTTPDRASLEDSQFEQAMEMRKEGVQIPDEVIIENSRLQRRSEIAKQLADQKNSPQAQQQQQLQMRAMEANVSKLEGEAKEKHTKSALDEARAKKESIEADQMARDGGDGDRAKMEAEMQMAREKHGLEIDKMSAELQMQREKHQMEIQQAQEKHAQDQQFRAQESAERAEHQRQLHYQQRVQQQQAAEQQQAQAEEAAQEKQAEQPTTPKE